MHICLPQSITDVKKFAAALSHCAALRKDATKKSPTSNYQLDISILREMIPALNRLRQKISLTILFQVYQLQARSTTNEFSQWYLSFVPPHVSRVYLTGGFKKPREFTWVTGVILAVLTVSFGCDWLFFTLGSD